MKRQINFETAMELAKRGKEVFTLMPTDGSDSWVLMELERWKKCWRVFCSLRRRMNQSRQK